MLSSGEVKHHFQKIVIAQDAIVIFLPADIQQGHPYTRLNSNGFFVWKTPFPQNLAGYSLTVTEDVALILSHLAIVNDMGIDGDGNVCMRICIGPILFSTKQ